MKFKYNGTGTKLLIRGNYYPVLKGNIIDIPTHIANYLPTNMFTKIDNDPVVSNPVVDNPVVSDEEVRHVDISLDSNPSLDDTNTDTETNPKTRKRKKS